MTFHDWAENPPEFISTYDVSSTAAWARFCERYTAGNGNAALEQVIAVAKSHAVQSLLVETRYIDADWRSERARFYSTTYVRYPSIAHRVHFFASPLPSDLGDLSSITKAYKGYSILRPLPSQPVGRTMIEPPPELMDGVRCESVEEVDVLGWPMSVRAMPFMSQDAQFLRCAHADVWMVLRHAYLRKELGRKLPADVQEATKGGYVIGRQVPSEGLSPHQMMAGMTNLGLSPAIMQLPQTAQERREAGNLGLFEIVCRYVNSNISPIIVSQRHVWLVVGYTRKRSRGNPKATLYRHDDSAGPYLRVQNPWKEPDPRHQPWGQVIVPLPPKIYMTGERAEVAGRWWFQKWLEAASSENPLRQCAEKGHLSYRAYGVDMSEFKFGLQTRPGFDQTLARRYRLAPWPRNLWVVEAVDRDLRNHQERNVLGEVIIDPTANHYPTEQEPGIIAAHAPGFWWMASPDALDEHEGVCANDAYASGRVLARSKALGG